MVGIALPGRLARRGRLGSANLELCLDELIAADLLPAPGEPEGPAERARQPADRAIAYLIKGYLVEWADWTPEMIREMERGEIKLGEAIRDGLSGVGPKKPARADRADTSQSISFRDGGDESLPGKPIKRAKSGCAG